MPPPRGAAVSVLRAACPSEIPTRRLSPAGHIRTAIEPDPVHDVRSSSTAASLMDFSRLVDVFDRHGVSFVSVTQAFNTATSMGRLTLNMLLSFAQIEREVTAERIRDKIAASRRKGMWMGGVPPYGCWRQASTRRSVSWPSARASRRPT